MYTEFATREARGVVRPTAGSTVDGGVIRALLSIGLNKPLLI